MMDFILKAHVSRRAQADWQGSLRSQKGVNGLTMKPKGLIALDLSLNYLSDSSIQTICTILRIGTPLEGRKFLINFMFLYSLRDDVLNAHLWYVVLKNSFEFVSCVR